MYPIKKGNFTARNAMLIHIWLFNHLQLEKLEIIAF